MATHSSILAWKKSHGQRSLVSYSPQGYKELDTTGWHMHTCVVSLQIAGNSWGRVGSRVGRLYVWKARQHAFNSSIKTLCPFSEDWFQSPSSTEEWWTLRFQKKIHSLQKPNIRPQFVWGVARAQGDKPVSSLTPVTVSLSLGPSGWALRHLPESTTIPRQPDERLRSSEGQGVLGWEKQPWWGPPLVLGPRHDHLVPLQSPTDCSKHWPGPYHLGHCRARRASWHRRQVCTQTSGPGKAR